MSKQPENAEINPSLVRWIVMTFMAAGALITAQCSRESAVQWRTSPVEKGDIKVEVTASGIANPHTVVQVGTQVSGTIAKLFVDFNSRVKKGQLIAVLDTTFLQAAVAEAAASLRKGNAQENLTHRAVERQQTLFDKGLTAQADLDQALADYESAKAALSSAQAQLDRAKINLAYASITSPISGVVINRAVDVGQTVAASFNTPTLFTIADDLGKMQVQASIDEADVGQVQIGQQAVFTVDAYPTRKFVGKVTQIRLQPSTVQNVVSYTVMIDVDNPDLALLPGMTANITVAVQEADDVFKVPMAALKFKPARAPGDTGRHHGGIDNNQSQGGDSNSRRSLNAGGGGQQPGDTGAHHHAWSGSDHPHRQGAGDSTGGHAAWSAHTKGQSRIFILKNNKPVPVAVKTGLSNGGFVAVEGEIAEGDLVIVGTITPNNNKPAQPQQQSPLGGGGVPGMGRRF